MVEMSIKWWWGRDSSAMLARVHMPSRPWTLFTAKLKRIDLTSNFISTVDEDSFRLLPSLQELILPENKLASLPELPGSIVQLDARFNTIQSAGIRPEAFQVNFSQIFQAMVLKPCPCALP